MLQYGSVVRSIHEYKLPTFNYVRKSENYIYQVILFSLFTYYVRRDLRKELAIINDPFNFNF